LLADPNNTWLAPTKEEQTLLILQGKCPHNQGWTYIARYADEILYKCRMCGESKTI